MNNKITSHQLFTLTALTTLGGSYLVVSSMITGVAKQDAWISALVTMVFGPLLMLVYWFLGTRYEGLNLLGIIQNIFGKWLGRIISAAYVIFFFVSAYSIAWWIGNFEANIMQETPVPVILLLYVAALVIGVYYGIESIGRASELFFVFVTVLFLISIIFVLPNAKFEYMQPIFENGPAPVLKGAIALFYITALSALPILMIFPANVYEIKSGKKALVRGYLWCNGVVFIIILVSVLILGSNVIAISSFPTVLLAREIHVGAFLTRLEYIISMMWLVSEFMVGMTFFYACIQGISELLGLKDHNKIVAPIGMVVYLYAGSVYPSRIEMDNWSLIGDMPNTMLMGLILPVVMIIVYLIKNGYSKNYDQISKNKNT